MHHTLREVEVASWSPRRPRRSPVRRSRIALVNDYDIVVMGIAHILEQYRDRVVIAELDTNQAVSDMVDIVFYDCFAQPESDHDGISAPT